MAEKEDEPVKRDLPELDKLVSEQDKKLTSCEEGLRRWRRYADDYRSLKDRLTTLPQQVSHQVTVPLGPLAFAPGRLVHTNELLVLLGDNWFAKTSAHAACGIVDRRLEQCDKTISDLEKERDLFTKWRDQAAAIQETDQNVQEIREPLDEDAETKWRQEHRRRVADHKRREAELRQEVADQTDVMARLDALEKLEELRDEMDRLSDDGGEDGDAADSDSDSESDSDGSVIIRPSPEPPLDSDDDTDPESSPPPESRSPPPAGRKRVSFSGSPGVNTVHLYDRDAPASGAGGDGGDGDGDDGDDGDSPAPAVEEPPRGAAPPVSILKPTDGRPTSPDPPVTASPASAAAAAAAAAAGAAWAAEAEAAAGAADGRVRWLGDGDSVPIVSDEQEEPLPPTPPPPQRPDLSKVFSYKIEERNTAAVTAGGPPAVLEADDHAEPPSAAPHRPVSRFRASRSRV